METFGKNFITEVAKALSEITREEIDQKEPTKEIPKDNNFDRIFEASDDIKRLRVLHSKVLAKTKNADSPSNLECLLEDRFFIQKLLIFSAEKMMYGEPFQKIKKLKIFKDWKMGIVFDEEKQIAD